jgi:hypothetical protein
VKVRVIILSIILAILVFAASSISFAQIETPASSPSASPAPEKQEKVNYDLPYPGLLPDSPLYFLKAIRDRVIQFLVSDPQKKAEFNLLSSDKRTNAGYYLIVKDKDDMGVLYISKGNNYMHTAIIDAKNAGEKGKTVLDKIKPSIKKHEEVVEGVLDKVDKTNRTKLQNELKRLSEFEMLINGKKK